MINHTLQYVIDAVLGILITGALTQIVRALRMCVAMHDAITAILHNQLYRTCEAYLDRGWVSTPELVDLEKLHGCYNSLGLDGVGDELYDRVRSLEIRNRPAVK